MMVLCSQDLAADLLQKKPRLKTQIPATKTSISLRTDLSKSQTVMVLCSQDLLAISIDNLRQNKCRSMGLKGAWEVYVSVLAVCLDMLLMHVKCIYMHFTCISNLSKQTDSYYLSYSCFRMIFEIFLQDPFLDYNSTRQKKCYFLYFFTFRDLHELKRTCDFFLRNVLCKYKNWSTWAIPGGQGGPK
jgi:hypothetical protein